MRQRRNLTYLFLFGLVFLMIIGAKGCEEYPPYDATGYYEGEWWSGEGEHCPITATMTMVADPIYPPLWAPQATFHVDFSCIEMPEGIPPLEPVDIVTAGLLDINGNLTYASGGCGVPFCIIFATAGVGDDLDEDGLMDTYAGTWSLTILLAGFQPFGCAGEFELNRTEEEPEALAGTMF